MTIVNDLLSYRNINWLIPIVLLIILGIFRKKIIEKFKEITSKITAKKDSNSVSGLKNKKVYTDSGDYVGKVEESILEKNKIYGLKIKLDKKFKYHKNILLKYEYVKNVSEVLIIDNKVIESLKDILSI